MLSFSYALTAEDYVQYYLAVVWDGKRNRRKRTVYFVRQVIFLLLLLAIFYYTGIFYHGSSFTYPVLGVILFTSLLSFIGIRSGFVKKAAAFAEDPANSGLFVETVLTVTEQSFHTRSALVESDVLWEAFVKKEETPAYYFLFLNATQAFIIPKRIFEHKDQQLQFEKLLSKKISLDAEMNGLLKS